MELSGSVCLVTGASSGIGAQTARLLVARGARVAATARREDLLDALGAASTHVADLSDPADALRMADAVLGLYGRVDVLVNNAGVRIDGPVAEVGLEELDGSFQVNALSPFALAGRLAPGMVERGSGTIVNIGSTAKAALESFTQTLRQEVGGGTGVGVFAFDPGWVRTALAPDGQDEPAAAAARLVAHLEAGRSSREILS